MLIYLTHISQQHMPNKRDMLGFNLAELGVFDDIAYSQFHVAKAILAEATAMVVLEGFTEDYAPATRARKQSLIEEAVTVFPQGLPDTFEQLSSGQKYFLAQQGGARTLFYLQKLTHIYHSATKKVQAECRELTRKGDFRFAHLFQKREEDALQCIHEIAQESKQDEVKVLLVYGATHDFSRHMKAGQNADVKLEPRIDTLRQSGHLSNRDDKNSAPDNASSKLR